VRGFLTFAVYRVLGALVGRLPPKAGYWLAGRMSGFLYQFSPQLRLTIEDNIRHVIGPGKDASQVEYLVRMACANILKGHYDLFRLAHLTPEEIGELLHLEGWENLERALELGNGAIIFSAHLGNVDLVMQFATLRGITAAAPVQRIEPERLFRYTLGLRTRHGIKLIPTDGPMMGLVRVLRAGGAIGLAADRDVADSSVEVVFFGVPTRLPDGPVRVALRTGAPLIPAFAIRLPDNSFQVLIEPPLDLQRTDDRTADVATGMKLVVAAMERRIAEHPEQWLVAQRIWPDE
jgi:KDO2-lipid IV(A) lauroyltransferase